METEEKRGRGRPSTYSDEKAAEVLGLLMSGLSLRKVTDRDDMPDRTTFFRWLMAHQDFRDQYEKAAAARADALFEEMFEIADEASQDVTEDGRINTEIVQRSKLRVDVRKWALARMNPRKFGERITQELVGEGGGPIRAITAEMKAKEAADAWRDMLGGDEG